MTLVLCLAVSFSNAQLTGWRYKDAIRIQENSGSQKINHQVLLTINTQALVSLGRMQSNGYDIRFAKDCGGSILYPYWIETGMNTANTKIWVLVDTLNASGARTINMYYGNSAVTGTTSFDSTFTPSSRLVVTAGSITLSGTNNYSWFEIQTGATVIVGPNSPFAINARKIKISGTLDGIGAGFLGGAPSSNGSGPGYGRFSTGNLGTWGGGGGAYGGVGGNGGGPSNATYSTTGIPGVIYGTTSTDSINMGSGGGGGASAAGNGGAGITLNGDYVEITGSVKADGADGLFTNLNGSGGGGSGGGIRIKGKTVSFSGTLSAKGGISGDGAYAGGGGGGGRVKLFYETSIQNVGITIVSGGGIGLQNSNILTATPGAIGTTSQGTYVSKVPTFTILPHVAIAAVNNPSCAGSNVTITATTGFATYNFYKNNVSVQNSASNTYSSTTLTNGNTIKVIAFYPSIGCSDTSNIITMTIDPLPVVTVSPAAPMYCTGGSTNLTAGGAATFAWSPATGLSATTGASVTANPTATTTYTVTGTSSSGCTNTATVTVTVNPNPVVSLGPNINLCTTSQTTLNAGNFPTYSWSDGSTASTLVVDGTILGPGTYTYIVYVTNANGCTNSDTVVVNVSLCTGINGSTSLSMTLDIYPNPSTGAFNISIGNEMGSKLKLEIMSIDGQLVFLKESVRTTGEQIDISDLAKGVYFLKVSDQDQVIIKRIVLE